MGTAGVNSSAGVNWELVDGAVGKFATKFWGIDTGHTLVPLPQTAEYKLEFLRKTLATAPVLDRQTRLWVEGRRQKTVAGIGKFLKTEIVFSKDIRDSFTDTPRTIQQAYRIPQINDRLHAHIAAEFSPIEYVHRGYMRYELYHQDAISESSSRIGHAALELFIFAAGGDEFTHLVQETTIGFYSKQIVRLDSNNQH